MTIDLTHTEPSAYQRAIMDALTSGGYVDAVQTICRVQPRDLVEVLMLLPEEVCIKLWDEEAAKSE